MDRHPPSHWKLGAIVSLILLGLVFFIFYAGSKRNLFSPTITLTGVFHNAGGVLPGNHVQFAGINVGEVTEMEFVNDSLVRFYMDVDQKAQSFIKTNSKLTIGSESLLGDKVVDVLKGSADSASVKDGAELATTRPFNTDKMLASIQRVSANFSVMMDEFSTMSNELDGKKGTIGRLLNDPILNKHLSNTSRNLSRLTADSSVQKDTPPKHTSFLKKIFGKKRDKEDTSKSGD